MSREMFNLSLTMTRVITPTLTVFCLLLIAYEAYYSRRWWVIAVNIGSFVINASITYMQWFVLHYMPPPGIDT